MRENYRYAKQYLRQLHPLQKCRSMASRKAGEDGNAVRKEGASVNAEKCRKCVNAQKHRVKRKQKGDS